MAVYLGSQRASTTSGVTSLTELNEIAQQCIQATDAANAVPTFVPSVSVDGVISWSNDKGADNPEPVNLKAEKFDVKQSSADVKSYGVAFTGGSNNGTRLYDAVGFTANVGTDTQTATNDFDNAEIYKDILPVNRVFKSNGTVEITARYGDDNFKWDGTNGEVQVEIPLFWYNVWTDELGRECWAVYSKKVSGALPSPAHVAEDGTIVDKCYISAKKLSVDSNGVGHSISGVFPARDRSMNTNLSAARKLNSNCCTTTNKERMTRIILATVEFATRDVQSVMIDFCTGIYDDNTAYTVQANATSTNTVSITATAASAFVVGQTVNICVGWITSDKVMNRIITAVDKTNNTMTLSGAAFDVTAGWHIYNLDWQCGATDKVLTPSGSPVSNTSGKYPCRYRYIEEPWGGGSEMITGLRTKRSGEEGFYTYELYEFEHLADDKGADNVNGMTATGIKLPTIDGYQKNVERTKFMPSAIGASSTTYYSDYYWHPRYEVCGCRLGGTWAVGRSLGGFFLYCGYPASWSNRYWLARLSTPAF